MCKLLTASQGTPVFEVLPRPICRCMCWDILQFHKANYFRRNTVNLEGGVLISKTFGGYKQGFQSIRTMVFGPMLRFATLDTIGNRVCISTNSCLEAAHYMLAPPRIATAIESDLGIHAPASLVACASLAPSE